MARHPFISLAASAAAALVFLAPSAAGADGSDRPIFDLYDPGTERAVNYEDYGIFSGIGTDAYGYVITDKPALARASGEGIDPSTSVEKDPAYRAFVLKRKAGDTHWKHVDTGDPQADFLAWATAYKEDPGVRLFFTARALEAGRQYLHALKAYRAAMVLYPGSFCWNRELTWTWLIAPKAWDAVVNITRMRPELGLKLTGAFVKAESAIGGDPTKNSVAVTPGRFIDIGPAGRGKAGASSRALDVVERRGGRVSACVKYPDGRWALEVEGKPFFVKGLTYCPTKVGAIYDWDWMNADQDRDGLIDTAYQTWVDTNRNGRRDDDEAVVGDFRLMRDMGCNVIRVFNTIPFNGKLLDDLYSAYGIRVLICDPLGAYTVHSGARWDVGTDYTDPDQLKAMRKSVEETVKQFRSERWLLGYVLGNENNMPADYFGVNAARTRAAVQPEAYAKFLNVIAAMIHTLDPDRIVGVGNMELGLVEAYAAHAPELDFIGVNSYPGSDGFGAMWIRARRMIDRPVLVTEFGCDAYATGKGPDEDAQARYLKNAWEDIAYNAAGGPGEGNSVGGIVFEWLDEWWKDTRGNPPDAQATDPTIELAFPDGFSQEEWLGVVGQRNGRKSPFLRDPRKAYYVLKGLWTKD